MREILTLIVGAVLIVLSNGNLSAQEKAKTEITSFKQKDHTILFTLTSSKPLIFADNRYVLYIGKTAFVRSEVPGVENNRTISFLITEQEFNSLSEGANMYFSYGDLDIDNMDIESYAAGSIKCWSMGKFSSALLTK